MDKRKTVAEINEKIKKGEAVVLTAEEFKQMVRNEEPVTAEDIDVVYLCYMCYNVRYGSDFIHTRSRKE